MIFKSLLFTGALALFNNAVANQEVKMEELRYLASFNTKKATAFQRLMEFQLQGIHLPAQGQFLRALTLPVS